MARDIIVESDSLTSIKENVFFDFIVDGTVMIRGKEKVVLVEAIFTCRLFIPDSQLGLSGIFCFKKFR